MTTGPGSDRSNGTTAAGGLAGRAWLAALPRELAAQRRVLAALAARCEAWPSVVSLWVGCSLGRGAADALSDIDAALGVDAQRGDAGVGRVDAAEALVAAALPELGELVDVLRHGTGDTGRPARVIFAQFADGTQLDLAVVAGAEIEARNRAGGAPDFIALYQAPDRPSAVEPGAVGLGAVRLGDRGAATGSAPGREWPAAHAVSADQVREWAFRGWIMLIDTDKYLRRGSLWEAHSRLHEARDCIWALWAAAQGALYPWHGLSQVLDHDPGNLPPGIESTVAGLDAPGLRRAARASAEVLSAVSAAAASRHPADLPAAMAGYVTRRLAREP